MFNKTKTMLEVIQEQSKTITRLTDQNNVLNEIRLENRSKIDELTSRVQELKNTLWENDINENDTM